jgi:acyl dehydratase
MGRDSNPIYRDEEYPKGTTYGALVASPSWVASVFPHWVLQVFQEFMRIILHRIGSFEASLCE